MRLGVDVSAAMNLAASLVRYLGLAVLVPIVFAIGNDEPAWPFLVAGVVVSGSALLVQHVTDGGDRVGVREGYLVIVVIWFFVAVFGALPYLLSGDDQLGRPSTRCSRRWPASRRPGRPSRLTSRRCRRRSRSGAS